MRHARRAFIDHKKTLTRQWRSRFARVVFGATFRATSVLINGRRPPMALVRAGGQRLMQLALEP